MREAITKALQVCRVSPELDDVEIFNRLVADGIERHVAARLVEFLPLAYCRILLANWTLANFMGLSAPTTNY